MLWSFVENIIYKFKQQPNLSLETHLARHELIRSKSSKKEFYSFVKETFPKTSSNYEFICLFISICIYAYKQHTNCNWKWRNNEEEIKIKRNEIKRNKRRFKEIKDLRKRNCAHKIYEFSSYKRFLLSLNTKALIGIV